MSGFAVMGHGCQQTAPLLGLMGGAKSLPDSLSSENWSNRTDSTESCDPICSWLCTSLLIAYCILWPEKQGYLFNNIYCRDYEDIAMFIKTRMMAINGCQSTVEYGWWSAVYRLRYLQLQRSTGTADGTRMTALYVWLIQSTVGIPTYGTAMLCYASESHEVSKMLRQLHRQPLLSPSVWEGH
jgi:hypothetical protein